MGRWLTMVALAAWLSACAPTLAEPPAKIGKEPERPPPKQAILTGYQLRPYSALIFAPDVPEGLPVCFARRYEPDTAACLSVGALRRIALGIDRLAEP